MIATAQAGKAPSLPDYFPEPLRRCRHEIAGILRAGTNGQGLPVDFCTSKIIEQDQEMVARLSLPAQAAQDIEHAVVRMEERYGLDRNAALADSRYAFIERCGAKTMQKGGQSREKTRSIRIDRVLMNRVLALPLFFIIIMAVFWLTFSVLGPWGQDWMQRGNRLADGPGRPGLVCPHGCTRCCTLCVSTGCSQGWAVCSLSCRSLSFCSSSSLFLRTADI